MRGEVEIWRGDELLVKESNMLVDGAGVLLADIMTANPSLSGIEDTATSSILDASNYTIQAISFGTSREGFLNDGHATDSFKEGFFLTMAEQVELGSYSVGAISHNGNYDGSSLRPVVGLPEAPNPVMKTFEQSTNVSASVGGVDVSSVFPGNGQLVNFTPSAVLSATMSGTPFSSITSAVAAASLMGGFPDSTELDFTFDPVRYHYENESVYFNVDAMGGNFNDASSMDLSGFVNMVMSSVPDDVYQMSSTSSGLCVSAAPDFAESGKVEFSTQLEAADLGWANIYGGIFHLGLWTIDLQKSLEAGNTPPFEFTQLDNPRKYRLFARKGLTKNLCHIEDNGIDAGEKNRTPLEIKWRIYFL